MKRVPSTTSTAYTITGAADELGIPRPTVASWVGRKVIEQTGLIDGKPAFSPADLARLQEIKDLRDAARTALKVHAR